MQVNSIFTTEVIIINIDQLESNLPNSNLPTSDLYFATPNTKQSSSFDLINTPKNPIHTPPETPNLPQKDIHGKESVRRTIKSGTLTANMFEEMKIENLKTEIISSLE